MTEINVYNENAPFAQGGLSFGISRTLGFPRCVTETPKTHCVRFREPGRKLASERSEDD